MYIGICIMRLFTNHTTLEKCRENIDKKIPNNP